MRVGFVAVLAALLLSVPAKASAHDADLRDYARTTWASFVAMTDERTGLPTDSLQADGTRDIKTSTTNIGAYLWSAVTARRLGIIGDRELTQRLSRTLDTLGRMDRPLGGQYWNWYDIRTGAKIEPPVVDKNWLSSVDNGWLAVGLKIVANSVPQLSRKAQALYDGMDFGVYYVPDVGRVRFHITPGDPNDSPCCYDTVVSESRIVDYLGIANGQLPPSAYFHRWRTFPDTCDYAFQEAKPVGTTRTYYGVDVFEGAYPYRGSYVVPSWGGSMFEALMPDLFVPEDKWAPRAWGVNHPLTVRAQILHGLQDAQYGLWGFSPANTPEGGYGIYGVDAVGMNPDGNASNEGNTLVDHGFAGCREGKPDPTAYPNGVVTPHASALALRYAPDAARANLAKLARIPGMYGRWGFRDSVNVQTRRVSDFYLSLDQGMLMGAVGNALGDDVLRRAFADRGFERKVRPVIGVEVFGAHP